MKRPKTWRELPYSVIERFLWEAEIPYDGYESSKAQAVQDCINGNVTAEQERFLSAAYEALDDCFLRVLVEQEIEKIESQLPVLRAFLKD